MFLVLYFYYSAAKKIQAVQEVAVDFTQPWQNLNLVWSYVKKYNGKILKTISVKQYKVLYSTMNFELAICFFATTDGHI